MKTPDTIPDLKTTLNTLKTNPKKGMYFLLGTDKATRKHFLWVKPTTLTDEELKVAKAGAQQPTLSGVLVFHSRTARPVFCGTVVVPTSFSKQLIELVRVPGAEILKRGTYVKLAPNLLPDVISRGEKTSANLVPDEGPGITDEAAEGVGAMFEQAEKEVDEHDKVQKEILVKLAKDAEPVLAALETLEKLPSEHPLTEKVKKLRQAVDLALKDSKKGPGAVEKLLVLAETLLKAAKPSGPENDGDARDAVRDVKVTDESEDEVTTKTSQMLDSLKSALLKGGKMIMVANKQELAEAYANDKNISVEQAMQGIDANQGRGFTATTGDVYVLDGAPETPHDQVHETVHLMSAPGRLTKILNKYGEQLNEGFTEYFTKEMCKKLKVEDAVSYPDHVAFITRVVGKLGYAAAYRAYMQDGGMDEIVAGLVKLWFANEAKIKVPAHKPWKKTNVLFTQEEAVLAMKKKISTAFPPVGPALNFWNNAVFA